MLLVKIILWCTVYPLVLLGYVIMAILQGMSFLFHSPVDIWNIISSAVEIGAHEHNSNGM